MFDNQSELQRIYDGHTRILKSHEARSKMKEGIDEIVSAVGVTMGPSGRCVVIQTSDGPPIVTKDGVTVSKSIKPRDAVKRMGASLVQEAASQTNEEGGDGTTTSTVLVGAIVDECQKFLVAGGKDPIHLKNELIQAAELVAESLENTKKIVNDFESLKNVATISANGDEKLGTIVAEAIFKTGKDGFVTVEDSRNINTVLEITEGLQTYRGYLSPYFINDNERMRVVYENCRVVLSDKKISRVNDLISILTESQQNRIPVLFIAEDYEDDVLQMLIANKNKAGVPVVAIKAPGTPFQRLELLRDMQAIVGGKHPIDDDFEKMDKTPLRSYGIAKKVVVDAKTTTIVADASHKPLIEKRIADLKKQLENPVAESEELDFLKIRIARLCTGAALIRVGGSTELEIVEKKYRIEDSLNATKAALEDGIVEGGGFGLIRAALRVKKELLKTDGGKIMLEACYAPARKIIQNSGKSFEIIIEKCVGEKGYNSHTKKYENLIESGVIDPVKVTKCAIRNSSSVAATFLQLEAIVFEEETK